jgi:predicted O-methyltransferase YrrM
MALTGTAAYEGAAGLPPLVEAAVELARATGFAHSCLPGQGELLRVLARGVGAGMIGETGTGCGVGLAWLAGGAHPQARLVSVERDPNRAAGAAEVFRGHPAVQVLQGQWAELRAFAPFDLLVLDGGGQGKGAEPPLDPADWLRPGGVLVMDDFSPLTRWPPKYDGQVDQARLWWLDHPRLRATQINISPEQATILATYIGPAGDDGAAV